MQFRDERKKKTFFVDPFLRSNDSDKNYKFKTPDVAGEDFFPALLSSSRHHRLSVQPTTTFADILAARANKK